MLCDHTRGKPQPGFSETGGASHVHMAGKCESMPEESMLLEDIALLLRREHERLEECFDVRLARQEELLLQLASDHPQQKTRPEPLCRQQQSVTGVAAQDAFKQAVSARVSLMQGPKHCVDGRSFSGPLSSLDLSEHFSPMVPSLDRIVENKQVKLKAEDRKKQKSVAFNKLNEEIGPVGSIGPALSVSAQLGPVGSIDSSFNCKSSNLKRAKFLNRNHPASQVFLREVKLGITSPERAIREIQDQFNRLAKSEQVEERPDESWQVLDIPRIAEVSRQHCRFLSSEDVTAAIIAVCVCNLDGGISGNGDLQVDLESFLRLMTAEEVPEDVESYVAIIREAFDNERAAHEKKLAAIAVSWRKQKGEYDDLTLAADVIGASVILLNGLVLGINSDVEPEHVVWRICEYTFITFFIVEILFHMYRQGVKVYFLGRAWFWNLFDLSLVCFALLDVVISEISRNSIEGGPLPLMSRTLRLARLSRLVRLLRFKVFAELKQMIYGVASGIRVLLWAIVLLIIFIYMVSIVIRQTIGEDATSRYYILFQNTPWTMFTVFRCLTDGCSAPDGTPLQVYLYTKYGLFFMLTYSVVFLFVSIGIFNLIMATFIDNVMAVSALRKQAERAHVADRGKDALLDMVVKFWMSDQSTLFERRTLKRGTGPWFRKSRPSKEEQKNGMHVLSDVRVTRDMLQIWMCHPDLINLLDELEISIADHSLLFDALDCDLSGEIEGVELVQGLMALRGPTEKIDVVSTKLAVKYMTAMLSKIEARICPP